MPVNIEHKLLFIHIPKTGGTSIEQFFGMLKTELLWYGKGAVVQENGIRYAPQHIPARILAQKFESNYLKFFTFSFVRNPYTRVLSEYFGSAPHLRSSFDPHAFEEWLDTYFSILDTDHKLPQHQFLFDDAGKLLVDFVGRYEKLSEDFARLLECIHYPASGPLQHLNRSSNDPHYSASLTPGLRNKIYKLFQSDFEAFGYSKDKAAILAQ